MLEDLLNDLESAAHWRRSLIERYPDDSRNKAAAEMLEQLKTEIQSNSGLTVAHEIEEIEGELLRLSEGNREYDLSALIEECGEYRRRVGFSEYPTDGAAYLNGLLDIYKAHRAKVKEEAASDYSVAPASPATPPAEVVLPGNLPKLPVQGPGPHFEFSKDGRIAFVPPAALDRAGNNIERLRRLHPTLRGLVRQLARALTSGNAPYATLAGRVEEYRKRIDQPLEMVDFSLLYVEGVRLANAERTARDEISRGELPPLSEAEGEIIQTLLELHGIFVLSTRDGTELIALEERYRRRPKEEREYRGAAIEFAQSLQNQPTIIATDAAAFVLGAAEQINKGANLERSGVVGTTVLQNVAVVLAAGAVVAALPIAGGLLMGPGGAIAGGLTGLLAGESLKKSKPFITVIAPLIAQLDQAGGNDLSKFKEFLMSIEDRIRNIARRNKNFHWLINVVDWVTPIERHMNLNLVRQITELQFSPEAVRILQSDNIVFVGDLVQKTEAEMLWIPNIGRGSLNEIKEVLAAMGLSLGMTIPGWPPENIEDAMEKLRISDQRSV